MSETVMPFNRILYSQGANQRELTAAQFLAIALHERMRAILEERVRFFEGTETIETRTALRALYKIAT